jgi:hypothetical protein
MDTKVCFSLMSIIFVRNFLSPINISRVTLEMSADTHACLHVKWLSFLSDFNQNWNVSTNFGGTS